MGSVKHNIGFTLGNVLEITEKYSIIANYSASEISDAYKNSTKLLGFNFVKEVGREYNYIPDKFTKKLLDFKIIDKSQVVNDRYEFYYADEEFINIFFDIVKLSLPDLEWNHRDLQEEILWDLEGAASRLVY